MSMKVNANSDVRKSINCQSLPYMSPFSKLQNKTVTVNILFLKKNPQNQLKTELRTIIQMMPLQGVFCFVCFFNPKQTVKEE